MVAPSRSQGLPNSVSAASMHQDVLEQINPPKPPFWRDPRYHRREGWTRYLLGGMSLTGAGLLMIPSGEGASEPISFQLARQETVPSIGFYLLIATLLYFAYRLFRFGQVIGSIACFGIVAGLGYIAQSDPLSSNHLAVFVIIALFAVGMHWLLAWCHEHEWLVMLAFAGTTALYVCFISLGIGERLLVASSTAAINVVFYDVLLV